MTLATPTAKKTLYQLKVSLVGITPLIFRRVLVCEDTHLSTLHTIIQIVMGWGNSHQHEFLCAGTRYSDCGLEPQQAAVYVLPESEARLCDVAPAVKSSLRYHYDFGDGWMHKIVVEKKCAAASSVFTPLCLGGARACPPEDCGGPWGYERLLHLLANQAHCDHAEALERVGGRFDAEVFDIETINRELERHFARSRFIDTL